jgi:hypothetical protein
MTFGRGAPTERDWMGRLGSPTRPASHGTLASMGIDSRCARACRMRTQPNGTRDPLSAESRTLQVDFEAREAAVDTRR